jgi:hypothetical protein
VQATQGSVAVSETEIVVFSESRYTAERIAGWLGVSTEKIRDAGPTDSALRTTESDILVRLSDDVEVEDVPGVDATETP